MKIFNIGRNDECICGSGKKYKKCCMSKVEELEIKLSNYFGKDAVISREGKEFIKILSILYGIKLNKNEKYFNVEKLLKLVDEAWMEEEDYSEDDVITFFQQMTNFIFEDKRLKYLRIPGRLFVEFTFNENEEEKIDNLMLELHDQYIIENYLLEISYALQNYDFTDEELKNLFHLISLSITDEYHSFLRVIVGATMLEISKAFEEIAKIDNEEKRNEKFFEIASQYISFNEYITAKMSDLIEEDWNKIIKEPLELPFFTVYLFYLKFLSKTLSIFTTKNLPFSLVVNFLVDTLDEILAEPVVFEKSLISIIDSLYIKAQQTENDELKKSFEITGELLTLPPNAENFKVFKNLFSSNILRYVAEFQHKIEEIDETVEIEKLISDEFFNKYVSYLESNQMTEERDLLKEDYRELKENIQNLSTSQEIALEKIKGLIKGELPL